MIDAMVHRGPDDSGLWLNEEECVAFGHRRLSILDVSSFGHQPMESLCGRYIISYNGEIYNHLELRSELSDYPFKSMSDTETILAAVSAWGLEPALRRFVGMFAFALWDRRERQLFLIRDRMGIKPIYYSKLGSGWLFGSELKSLKAHPHFRPALNREALNLYFRHNYIPAPFSVYMDTWKLEPGSMAIINSSGLKLRQWWDTDSVWRAGQRSQFSGSDDEAVNSLESVLLKAISARMLSDVPLGAFLSGGIDSSTVVALMQTISSKPVRTYSIGFREDKYNEATYAKAVATHLATDHTEFYVSPRDMLDVLPAMAQYWDEPFADSSQVPTYLLSRLASEHVTVSLSGDGGDELFSGYERYFWATRMWNNVQRLPASVRSFLGGANKVIPDALLDLLGANGFKIRWRLDAIAMKDFSSFYKYFTSVFKKNEIVLGVEEPESCLSNLPPTGNLWGWMELYDLLAYLPDDILTKVDRASMAASLEARVPLLDHRVVEFAASLPMSMKVRDGKGKWLLRQVLHRYVPQTIVERPKMGFGIPMQEWLQTQLKKWCCDMLDSSRIKQQGYLDASRVELMLNRFMRGEILWGQHLWSILMFQSWLEEWE